MNQVRQASEILTVREAAARLKCSVQTIARLFDEGLVHAVLKRGEKGNCMRRTTAADLEAFFNSRRQRKRQDVTRYRRGPRNGGGNGAP